MRHQHYTAPELSTFHLDEASYTLLNTSPKKHITENNDINVIGSPEEDDAHDACAKEFMFLDEDDFDDSE
ncbi:hypothetical protein [Hoylesella buccalis]|uniref:hypothetical protein n=1 Tax=Hoylesella buccalis TaxID=28127 RepID=UPI00058C13BB|nr:hypothetical protein [Hoylesella buccalis]